MGQGYDTLTGIADVFNVAGGEGATVAENLIYTASASETVTAAVLGAAGMYGYKKYNA